MSVSDNAADAADTAPTAAITLLPKQVLSLNALALMRDAVPTDKAVVEPTHADVKNARDKFLPSFACPYPNCKGKFTQLTKARNHVT